VNAAELRQAADLDRLIHEPARLVIVTILSTLEKADFRFLLTQSGLTKGNLSAHLSKLEAAGYVHIEKTYRGKIPQTLISLTPEGQAAFEAYRKQLKTLVDSFQE
jgi:DNA-binding MarR family transcriptional regulator